jgi:FkbM family methyltransferase
MVGPDPRKLGAETDSRSYRMASIKQSMAMFLLRPYVRSELPGWGLVYDWWVGGYAYDQEWKGLPHCWVRGKLHGYEMWLDLSQWSNRSTFFLGRFYDLPTQLLLSAALRPGDTFIDVGANEGMISLLASHIVGSGGKVISFEPNPKPRAVFQAAIERNKISNIILQNVGLGADDGVFQLTVPKINTGEGSFGKPNYPPDLVNVVDCAVFRADDVLYDISPRLIKIDVEGFEYQVVKGMVRTIERSHPAIVMEIVSSHLKAAGTSVQELASFMMSKGYSPFRLALSRKKLLKLVSFEVSDDAHGDYFWLHPENSVIDPRNFS